MALFTTWEQDEYFRRKQKEADNAEFERILRESENMEFETLSPKRKTLFRVGIALFVTLALCTVAAIINHCFTLALCSGILCILSTALTAPRLVQKKSGSVF